MPTHDEFEQFMRGYRSLPKHRRLIFRQAVRAMGEDMRAGQPFRASLRVSVLSGYPGIYEMTWEMPNGRATFMFAAGLIAGEQHIEWRRISGHEVYKNP
ncbi:MAG TPA: hypothetical protein VIG30_00370 [Ktedonobacterales bacterium]|jgi:hypothetical protein